MTDWKTGFKEALLRYLHRSGHPYAVQVLSWTEEIDKFAYESGCDTCGWGASEVYELEIQYLDSGGDHGVYRTEMPFGELVEELIREN